MAVMRVEKNSNYTVMANYHLRDKRLSLKAKGLLSVMISLPAEWDYTLAGLAFISKEGVSAIRAAIQELEENGYVTVEHVDTAVEALAVSIAEKAAVDLPFMAELTGKREEEIASDLTGVIFRLPAPVDDEGRPRFVTADEYLSGNVRHKLRDARAAADLSPIFEPNVQALEKAQPKDLDASEIDVRLGATWVDKEYIQQFMHELFEVPLYQRRAVQVQYSNFTSEWRISDKTSLSYSVQRYTWATLCRGRARLSITSSGLHRWSIRLSQSMQSHVRPINSLSRIPVNKAI